MLYEDLQRAASRPRPFEFYTADVLWTDEHISERMLEYHLNPDVGLASRRHDFIDRSAEWIARRFALGAGVSVADFGCGPGLYTSRLARSGAAVTGIDFSRRSVDHARAEAGRMGLDVDYVLADYLKFDTDARFDLTLMIFCDICALSPAQRAVLLGKFRRLMRPGGAVLLDVSSLAAFAKWKEIDVFERRMMNGFWSAADYVGFRFSFKYADERVTLDKYVIVERTRSWEVYNWLQYFSVETLRQEMEAAGLRIVEVLSDVAGNPYSESADQFAVVAMEA